MHFSLPQQTTLPPTVAPLLNPEVRDDDFELRLKRRMTPPYWWPDAQVMMQLFLAVSIVALVAYMVHALMEEQIKLDQDKRDLLMIMFGIILGCFKDVFGYTFGSSAGQKRQGEVITESLRDKDKIIATNAASTAETALRAATAVAPAAAAAAAPPAAEDAAPPAAEEAVDQALADKGLKNPWWTSLTEEEKTRLSAQAALDVRVQAFITASTVGSATKEDLDYLVTNKLLTRERADELLNS